MANIKLEVGHELVNGLPVTFAAPCNCTEIAGLKVYYPGGSKEFTFKDAHGNALTGLGNLFSKGAYVKAILDVTGGNAYLQNADTNAYLEAQLARPPVFLDVMFNGPNTLGMHLSVKHTCQRLCVVGGGSKGKNNASCVLGNGDLLVGSVGNHDHILVILQQLV